MKDLPHQYFVTARGAASGTVALSSPGVATLQSEPPPEFGGGGAEWSPETLLCAAVADCFLLTFRAIARAAQLSYVGFSCDVAGKLDRVEGQLRFTEFVLRARLAVAPGTDEARARSLLEKAERGCLVSRSLSAAVTLAAEVIYVA